MALTDLRIFVDTSLDVCLARRLTRDIVYRGREIDLSVIQWQRFVKPNFEQFVRHSMYNANIRIPRGIDNIVAIDMLVAHIQRQLEKKSATHLNYLMSLSSLPTTSSGDNSRLSSSPSETSFSATSSLSGYGGNDYRNSEGGVARERDLSVVSIDTINYTPLPHNVIVLEQTPQVKAMHTILLNTVGAPSRADFIFFFNRIASLLIQRALDELEYAPSPNPIVTPINKKFKNSTVAVSLPSAVELIRGGECFETSLKRTVPTIPIGKILIQSDSRTGEPHLHSLKLPPSIDPRQLSNGMLNENDCKIQSRTKIILCDSQFASGAAATMSVAILLDHGILEENIIIVVYISSEIAVRRLFAAFPKVKVIVGFLDAKVYPRFVDSLYYGTL